MAKVVSWGAANTASLKHVLLLNMVDYRKISACS